MSGAGFTMEIELGKIREFARATKSTNADYLKADRPVSPPTFLMTKAFWSGEDGVPWDLIDGGTDIELSRVLHGGQEFVFHGEPPRAGTRLVGRSRVGADYVKEGRRGGTMRFIEFVQELRTTDGRPVVDVKTTIIVTGAAPASSAGTESPAGTEESR